MTGNFRSNLRGTLDSTTFPPEARPCPEAITPVLTLRILPVTCGHLWSASRLSPRASAAPAQVPVNIKSQSLVSHSQQVLQVGMSGSARRPRSSGRHGEKTRLHSLSRAARPTSTADDRAVPRPFCGGLAVLAPLHFINAQSAACQTPWIENTIYYSTSVSIRTQSSVT